VDIDDRIELTSRVATSGRRRGTSPESNRKAAPLDAYFRVTARKRAATKSRRRGGDPASLEISGRLIVGSQ
jgi:hypothetical protein